MFNALPLFADLLGSHLSSAASSASLHETRRRKRLNVDGALSLGDEIGDDLTGDWRPQNAPAGTRRRHVGVGDAVDGAEDGQRVGGARSHTRLRHQRFLTVSADALRHPPEATHRGGDAARVFRDFIASIAVTAGQ